MHVLWIATKVPVPPVDGGRLVQKLTLEALAERGVRVTLLAPLFPGEDQARLYREAAAFCEPLLVPVAAPSGLSAAARTLAALRPGVLPPALARHAHRPLRRRAGELVASRRFSLVHAEQLHALPQAEAALEGDLPVVLRAQNVESDLWAAAADRVVWPARPAARWEARRLARWEGEAVARVARTVALTGRDAARLEELAGAAGRPVGVAITANGGGTTETGGGGGGAVTGGGESGGAAPGSAAESGGMASGLDGIRPAAGGGAGGARGAYGAEASGRLRSIPAPFPGVLPPGPEPLPGEPAVVVLASGGWMPNRDSRNWMEDEVWPAVRRRVPGARLHLFGGGGARGDAAADVARHPAPQDSARAFAPGSVLVVPLRIASGVRMKILEAWARGVAVVATPEAAAGLVAQDGRELLVASGPEDVAAAVARLAGDPDLYAHLTAAGRAALERHHDPARVAEQLEAVYREVARPVRGGR